MNDNTKPYCQRINALLRPLLNGLDIFAPLAMLSIRLWIGMQFFTSGLTKLHDWDSTLYLFTYEHPVPFIPPALAAYSGTFFELACPVLLWLGLGARFATLPLLAMTVVIEFTYTHHESHLIWALMLGLILTHGAGKLSADYWIRQRCLG